MEKFQDLKYTRPDFDAAEAEAKAHIERVKNAESWEALRTEWLDYAEQSEGLATMYTIASIRNTVDTTDPFYDEEIRCFNKHMPTLNLLERQADAALLASPYVAEFKQEFGEILVTTMKNNQRFADERLVPLQIKEGDLRQQYSKASATAMTEYHGKQLNFYGLLKEMLAADQKDRKEALHAWGDLYARIAPELDRIYDELIDLRCQMADLLGFKSYTDMAYLQRRRFDYNQADAKKFRDEVLAVVTPACVRIYEEQRKRLGIDTFCWPDESMVFADGNAAPKGTTQELIDKALAMYQELSPETAEFFSFMTEHNLFDLESKPGKRPGGYCTSMPAYKAPFIFSNFNGTAADADVLTHEAGHAFEYFTASRLLPLGVMTHSTSEINEIHSMSMEHFTYPWMDKFFGEETKKYLYGHLWGALNVMPYMCCVDEFQHHVYNEKLDAAGRRACWKELEKKYMPWRDYAGHEFLEEGGFWMQKQHIFLYPFYYIEYALAQVCALQFYLRMTEDRDEAWASYLKLCRAGGSLGYFQLLELAGLKNPFREGTVVSTMTRVLEKLDAMAKDAGI